MSELNEAMHREALAAQKFTRKYFVVELDFRLETLDELDGQFKVAVYALRGGLSPENVARLVDLWGAYLGEVIRRTASDANWIDTGAAGTERWRLVRGAAETAPHRAIADRAAHGVPHLRAFYDEAVQKLGAEQPQA